MPRLKPCELRGNLTETILNQVYVVASIQGDNMPKFNERGCQICGTQYIPTGPAARYCSDCAAMRAKVTQREGNMRHRARRGLPVGVGRGGSNKRFSDDSQFKTGIGNFFRLRKQLLQENTICEECGEDISEVSPYHKCVHHIDHDRTNNVRENLRVLCKRCHQLHHNCTSNFTRN